MRPVRSFTVTPTLPEGLERLGDLVANLRWTWDHGTIALFRRLDADLWEATGHNPVLMLGSIEQERLQAAALDEAFVAHYRGICQSLDDYVAGAATWYAKSHPERALRVAYFSAEFGLTECLPIYSGGMGVLAGDHLKASSDLGVPIAGVGLLYQQGYFHQYLNVDGWQQEQYVSNDFYTLPVSLQRGADGRPVTVTVGFPDRTVAAQIWKAQVGRVPLYLLDTNTAENSPQDRMITDQLYGGDQETRIQQEMMLGIGGLRALQAVGWNPTVLHLNEGHAAFAALERTRLLVGEQGLTFPEAAEAAAAAHVFTTHTPVLAGHDYFPQALVERYLGDYCQALGLSRREFLALGRRDGTDDKEPFCMTILAMRLAAHRNAVSRLHGEVTRRMWQGLWPRVPSEEVPIKHVSNGVHFRSWISHDLNQLYDRYVGPRWRESPADEQLWRRVEAIPTEELWRTHERRRERLVAFARQRLQVQLRRRGAPASEIALAEETLDPEALTIGFARRFATYKRATLLLRDTQRLATILNRPGQPVQVIFAGKAHPRDEAGKELIRQIVHLCRDERFCQRIVFLEDYDMNVARYLVQGCDVWLNTPLRPMEASGTSGMKAAANGALNVSTLDGWWDEAYAPALGWSIGSGEAYEDGQTQDAVESSVLYDILEHEVVPLFYDRGRDRLPRGWIARMKAAMRNLCPMFNANRVASEYVERCYLPSFDHGARMSADGMIRSRQLAAWKRRVRDQWASLRIEAIEGPPDGTLSVGSTIEVRARISLGSLGPEDVLVQLCVGRLDAGGAIAEPAIVQMRSVGRDGDLHTFAGKMEIDTSGRHGLTVRLLPRHDDLLEPAEMGLVVWA